MPPGPVRRRLPPPVPAPLPPPDLGESAAGFALGAGSDADAGDAAGVLVSAGVAAVAAWDALAAGFDGGGGSALAAAAPLSGADGPASRVGPLRTSATSP